MVGSITKIKIDHIWYSQEVCAMHDRVDQPLRKWTNMYAYLFIYNTKKGGHQVMTPIELFAWTLSAILGISFIISLAAVARKPRYITKTEHKRTDLPE